MTAIDTMKEREGGWGREGGEREKERERGKGEGSWS
jgi:hypothetical protein